MAVGAYRKSVDAGNARCVPVGGRPTASADYEPKQLADFVDFLDGGLLDCCSCTLISADAVSLALVDTATQTAKSAGLSHLMTHASRTAKPGFQQFESAMVAYRPGNIVNAEIVPNYG